MKPSDEDRMRGKNPFDSIDDEEFEQIFDEIQRMFESTDFREMIKEIIREEVEQNKRVIHWLCINMLPVEKPKIQRYCKCPIKNPKEELISYEEPLPLPDIIEGDEDVAITVEIPSVEKEDINLDVAEGTLEIAVDTAKRKYHELLNLPCDVKPKTMKATYKNSVLDVVVKRKKKKKLNDLFKKPTLN